MAVLFDHQRELNTERQLRRAERRLARQVAQNNAARAFDRLLSGSWPEWFTAEQIDAYRDELRRLQDRFGSPTRG